MGGCITITQTHFHISCLHLRHFRPRRQPMDLAERMEVHRAGPVISLDFLLPSSVYSSYSLFVVSVLGGDLEGEGSVE